MHAAPPVRISLVPDRAWCVFGTLCAAMAAANGTAWAAQYARVPGVAVVAAAIIAATLAALLCVHAWRRHYHDGAGVLVWDGAQWLWTLGGGTACAGEARVMLDLGSWLLLRFEAMEGAARWMVATQRMAGAAWPAWRTALYARRPRRSPAVA